MSCFSYKNSVSPCPRVRVALRRSFHTAVGRSFRQYTSSWSLAAYVGDIVQLASEYHENDFAWEEHAVDAAHIVSAQESAAAKLKQPSLTSTQVYDGQQWEQFYQQHPSAKFFKERRYILLEFPILAQEHPAQHIFEIGCGCGSSLLPVLRVNRTAIVSGSDISGTCLQQLHRAAESVGIAADRISTFTSDATLPSEKDKYLSVHADIVLIMFTLSAVSSEQQAVMLSHAFRALKPGGLLLIRDHGLYDMVQLRIPPEQFVSKNCYKRGDGTLAYFFSTEDLEQRATEVGFEVIECKYVCVNNRNRKTGQLLRRVFVHAILSKPLV